MERPELGVLLSRLLREIIRREQAILDRVDLQMWDYIVLAALEDADAPTQAGLAAATGRDKTRLIGNLDRLAERSLITRTPDPADRRNRIVALTAAGRRVHTQCRARIGAMEDDLLGGLTPSQRDGFERVLLALYDELPDRQRI